MIEIKEAKEKDLNGLAKMYKQVFKLHNVFEKPEEEVLKYMKSLHDKYTIIVAAHDDEIVGGCVVVARVDTEKHKLSQIKHVAVLEEYRDKGVGTELVKKAEDIIGRGKIEIHIAQAKDDAVGFYKELGYEVEGELKSHYRKGETCILLGKVLE
jgi:ribosomal protein S18 acetylase RimI-like enzyme